MRTAIQYTLLRLLVFFVSLLLLWLLPPLRDNLLLLLIVATTVSMLISVFALNGMRNRMSAELATRLDKRHRRNEAKRADEISEDAEDEAIDGAQPAR